MKAAEYLEKYGESLKAVNSHDEAAQALAPLLTAFMQEAIDISNARKANRNEAFVSILKELNDKWNKLVRLDPDTGLKADGFKAWCMSQYSDILVHYWT